MDLSEFIPPQTKGAPAIQKDRKKRWSSGAHRRGKRRGSDEGDPEKLFISLRRKGPSQSSDLIE